MTDKQATYAKPTEAGYKPLVLIVRSPHLYPVQNIQKRDALLKDWDNVSYVRSLVIAHLAWMYNPVNIYIDGMTRDYTEKYAKPILDDIVSAFELQYSRQKELPQLNAQTREWLAQAMPKEALRLELDGEFPQQYGQSIPMGDYDSSRLIYILAVFKFHGAQITILPGDQDSSLLFNHINALKGGSNSSLARSFQRERDSNLYARVLTDLKCGNQNAIVHFGYMHEMAEFRETPHFDVAWVNVKKSAGSKIEIEGMLSYKTGRDPDKIQQLLTNSLKSFSIDILVNLNFRPHQLVG